MAPWKTGWFYDLSATAGRSNAQFYIYNTINPQLLWQRNEIDTYYEAGAYTETDRVLNFDLSKPFDVQTFGTINVAAGLEYRDETFRIDNGEPNSFYIDPNLEHGLASQGFGVGSNGFPGFQPGDAGENTVRSFAAYLDLESNVSENLLLGGALRYENYAEYGNTLDGKIAARLQVGYNLAIRGAVSTGFRVPTAGQANLRNVTTEFNMGFLADIATLPPTNPIAQQKGATALTPEESVNTTLGVVFDVGGVDVTVDYYRIEIKDRISFTSRFNLTPADITALLAAGVSDAQSFTSVRFFSNLQTVEASGVDVVATWPFSLGQGMSNLTFAGNWQSVDLTKFNPDFTSDNRRLQIEQGRPDSRFTLTWTHTQGRWRLMGARAALRRILRRPDQRRLGGVPSGREPTVRCGSRARSNGLRDRAVRSAEHVRRVSVHESPRRGGGSRLPGTVAVRLQRRVLLRAGAMAYRVGDGLVPSR